MGSNRFDCEINSACLLIATAIPDRSILIISPQNVTAESALAPHFTLARPLILICSTIRKRRPRFRSELT